ncbi:MAG TPA: 1-(5-phosphoribosyl)-5-[(5-phosphoribosylamino)methylideneamino]imidazole-4-carboxamide isomerase [Acidimicrobiales bacterium]|nr:1-(5-phosphoribosyl)-5-[(5-phosphoribosylamino)methylideneamino]imidazole-4-carboxamide isomerase [Acidimicrobiales bacterium]
MDLYPAIDLRGGRCVRLYQGDYDKETAYGTDPVTVAERFAAAGARWIHVVDLDAARTGVSENIEMIAAIARAVSPGVSIEAGGGIRDQVSAETMAKAGVARVVIGTAAVESPQFVKDLAAEHRVAVGLDARDGDTKVRGWTEPSGHSVVDLASWYEEAGVEAFIVTDIGRDGTLAGPDVEGLAHLLESTTLDIVASGGVGSLADLETLATLEVGARRPAGVIVGKALHDGLFTVEEAILACAVSG